MATGKLAAQIECPLNAALALAGPSCLAEPGNLNSPMGSGLRRVCDGGSDGAVIHHAMIQVRALLDAPVQVLLFVSDQSDPALITPENTRLVCLGIAPAGAGE